MVVDHKEFESFEELTRAVPNEAAAIAHFTSIRWQSGESCPYCGHDKLYHFGDRKTHKCARCKQRFSIKVGTIFEDSHIPLHKWVIAFGLMCSSKKGISALQLQRNLGLGSYKTAWHHICQPFMSTTLEATFCRMTRSRRIDMVIEGEVLNTLVPPSLDILRNAMREALPEHQAVVRAREDELRRAEHAVAEAERTYDQTSSDHTLLGQRLAGRLEDALRKLTAVRDHHRLHPLIPP